MNENIKQSACSKPHAERGIYTLANDTVCDSLVALLNSIERNGKTRLPVCIIPFNDQLQKVRAAIAGYENVFIYGDQEVLKKWHAYIRKAHPHIQDASEGRLYGTYRKFCAFDGPFDRFVFMDADTLLMAPLDGMFEYLNSFDFIAYDYQRSNPQKVFNVNSERLKGILRGQKVDRSVFCSGFFASKKGLFSELSLNLVADSLAQGDAEVLYEGAGEQPLLNYMVLKSGINSINLANLLPLEEQAGNTVVSMHFKEMDYILYDKSVKLTYLHYIGIAPGTIEQLCNGKDVKIPYRDIFLYYRFLREPGNRPVLRKAGSTVFLDKLLTKFKKIIYGKGDKK